MPTVKIRKRGFLWLLLLVVILFASFLIFKDNRLPKTTMEEENLVEGFPQAPIYPGSTFITSSQGTEEGFLYEATWETKDSVPEVSQWFINNFSEGGWEINNPPAEVDDPNIQLLVVRKNEFFYNLSFLRDTSSSNTHIIVQIISESQMQEAEEEE